MATTERRQGRYELFVTSHGHHILVLDGKEWFAWIRGQQSPILVQTDSDHEKERTLARGRFYLLDVEDDPELRDVPHLFLEQDDRTYREIILPNGLPTERDHQKRLVETERTVGADEIQRAYSRRRAA